MIGSEARDWAAAEFGAAELGDSRRTQRLVTMAAAAAMRPSGVVSEVFNKDADRQGAYDFLESSRVDAGPLVDAMGRSCAARSATQPFAFVPVDGTSLTIVDHAQVKGFGRIGTYWQLARGLKVLTALAIDPSGAPLGVAHLEWWNRPRYTTKARNRRPVNRESQKWTDTILTIERRFQETSPETRLWFQLDREGDSVAALVPLAQGGHWFTIRSQHSRRLRHERQGHRHLWETLHCRRKMGEYAIDVPARPGQGRRARLSVRCGTFTLALREHYFRPKIFATMTLNVVSAREVRTTPRGERRLEWILLTNRPTTTMEEVRQVIHGYTQRWRIEDFHRAWKSGACNVETTQLRGPNQVAKWATILAAVAARAEHLKRLSRSTPDEPASVELSPAELVVLRLLKEKQKRSNEVLPDRLPTLREAVVWIAQMGGYIDRKSQGPPGMRTIQRGLDHIAAAVQVVEHLSETKKMR